MTSETYQQRLQLLGTVATWAENNPFRIGAIRRLEGPGLAILGGMHAPPRTADDRHVMAGEDSVALMRDYPAAVTGEVLEW